jgi:hypothetical protein
MTPELKNSHADNRNPLPSLPLDQWKGTLATLHMWAQMAGKVRLALCPLVNHYWNVALYVTARGFATSPMPYSGGTVEIQFDFNSHKLIIETSDGNRRELALQRQSVAEFYQRFMALLAELGVHVRIWPMPAEIPDPIRFDQDRIHASYDPETVHKFWRILVWVDEVFKEFRGGFIGKCSPVHFWWGSFDHAVSRFSGRRAPERPGADRITREAYSHEVSSAGFWAGSGNITGPAFYSYIAPEPAGFADHPVKPGKAYYDQQLKEFVLLYDDVRTAASPRQALLDFLLSTYEAAATLAHWDRKALER